MKAKNLFFKECHLAGRQYHDVDEVWNELKVGTVLRLERDFDNRYDEDAVAVMYDAEDGETYFLGYVPSHDNDVLAAFLGMGWNKCFTCRISKLNPEAHYENQIHFTIRIRRNEEQ